MIDKILKELTENSFHNGKCLGSKSGNRNLNPVDYFVFNANLCIKINNKVTKIWYGDINISKDYKLLKSIAKNNNTIFYIFN